MAVAVMVIIIRVAVVVAVIMAAIMVMAPGKGSGKNPEKSSLQKKGKFPSGLLTRDRARVRVIGAPINILPG